jgi:hypothetical protein
MTARNQQWRRPGRGQAVALYFGIDA